MDGNGCITHEFMKGLHRYHSGLAIWVYIAFFFLNHKIPHDLFISLRF